MVDSRRPRTVTKGRVSVLPTDRIRFARREGPRSYDASWGAVDLPTLRTGFGTREIEVRGIMGRGPGNKPSTTVKRGIARTQILSKNNYCFSLYHNYN